jgi:hypothetical protein
MNTTSDAAGAKTPSEIVRSLEIGKFTTLKKIEQGGALQARKLANGAVQFYWRYTHEGKTDRVPLGTYDATAPVKSLSASAKGYSIAAAAETCRLRATIHHQAAPAGGYRAHLASEKRQREERVAAEHAAAAAEIEQQAALDRRAKYTLLALMTTYADYLQSKDRGSHADVRSIVKLHIEEAAPEIAHAPADSVTDEQIANVQRKLVEAKKGRTANKLRSYVGAAYQCAIKARTSATLPEKFKDFGVHANPAAATSREPQFDRADKRPLSLEQLRTYWQTLEGQLNDKGAALRLHLLSGGQRIAQLVRVWAKEMPHGIADFQLKRVRSGVETALAAARVSKDDRGHLQSHGLTGVQAKHYDDHDYIEQKREALLALFSLLIAGDSVTG